MPLARRRPVPGSPAEAIPLPPEHPRAGRLGRLTRTISARAPPRCLMGNHAIRVTTAHTRAPEYRSRQQRHLGGHHERAHRRTTIWSIRHPVLARKRPQGHRLLVGPPYRRHRMGWRRAGHPSVRPGVCDDCRRPRRAHVPGPRHREPRAGEVGRAHALGLGALRRPRPFFHHRLVRRPHRHPRRPGGHAGVSVPGRRRVVDGAGVPQRAISPLWWWGRSPGSS